MFNCFFGKLVIILLMPILFIAVNFIFGILSTILSYFIRFCYYYFYLILCTLVVLHKEDGDFILESWIKPNPIHNNISWKLFYSITDTRNLNTPDFLLKIFSDKLKNMLKNARYVKESTYHVVMVLFSYSFVCWQAVQTSAIRYNSWSNVRDWSYTTGGET